ncbi:exonuclease/endonuclease/phosphatase family protein [Microlunatus ginsengisoli]|uniref:Endonuclease/exonuclease/phosphatase domain-containing protein n=1 Tax=Microlunatus ginsengisoli TaxID=363863 RepID=A0ABP7AHJ3_9ACTN
MTDPNQTSSNPDQTGRVSGADGLLTRESTSDGSMGGDARELVENAAAGARVGAKVGSGYGAAIGAAAGTAVTAVKNKRTRRRLVIVLTAPTLAGVLAWTMVIVALGSLVADHDQARDGMSQAAAGSDGVTDQQIGIYRAGAESSGVSWMLLGAVDRSAGHWAGPGDPPYGITDLAAFNTDLTRHSLTPLTAAQLQDRVAAAYAFGRLFADRLAEIDPDVDADDLAAGAGVMTDPADSDRQILAVDPDDSHANAIHERVRSAFISALAAMPSTTATDATAIFDAAYRWAIGQPQTCGTDPFAQIAGDPGVPRPTGAGARIDVTVATWNTLYTNPAARVVDGIRSIGVAADVIGLQEVTSSRKRAEIAARLGQDWQLYAGGDGNNTTPVVWRKANYDLLAHGAVEASGLVRIEPGASGTVLGPRWITWVQLRDRSTGGAFSFVNTHLIPTIDAGGRPARSRPQRLRVYDQQIGRLLGLIDKLKAAGPVIGTIDANIDARGDATYRDPRWPYAQFARHGVSTNWRMLGAPATGGTHDTRLIDWVWSTTGTIIPTSQQVGDSYGSDHHSLRVSLSSAAPPLPSLTTPASGVDAISTGAGGPLVPDRLTVPGGVPGST